MVRGRSYELPENARSKAYIQWMIDTTEADKSDPTTFINEIIAKLTDLILVTCKETLQKVKAPAAEENQAQKETTYWNLVENEMKRGVPSDS